MVIGDFFLQRPVCLPLGRMPEECRWSPHIRFAQPVDLVARRFRKLIDELFHRLVV
jgi:hypothetical protein